MKNYISLHLLFGLFLLLPGLMLAQNRRVFHQTFQLDSVKVLYFDVVDSLKVEPWAGNVAMSETKISVLNASKGVMKFLVEEAGRYNVDVKINQDTFSMVSKIRERKAMHTVDGRIMEEEVYIRVFVPKEYEMIEPNLWVLPKEEENEKTEEDKPSQGKGLIEEKTLKDN